VGGWGPDPGPQHVRIMDPPRGHIDHKHCHTDIYRIWQEVCHTHDLHAPPPVDCPSGLQGTSCGANVASPIRPDSCKCYESHTASLAVRLSRRGAVYKPAPFIDVRPSSCEYNRWDSMNQALRWKVASEVSAELAPSWGKCGPIPRRCGRVVVDVYDVGLVLFICAGMRGLGRDLTGPRSFQTSSIKERSRPSLR
jgi:hypothetical protein